MAQNKIIFSTYCPESLQDRFGTKKLVNSFRYFHPENDIVVYGEEDINRVYQEYNVNLGNALPCLILDAKRKYDSEYVVHVDSDSLCLSRLDEILKFDYEIASARNNWDGHTGDERQNRPQCLWDLPNNKYVNCGLTATNSEKFLLEWIELNGQITKSGGIKSFSQADIQWYNYLFHYGGYKSKILDDTNPDSGVFYGPSMPPVSEEISKTIEDPPHIIKEYGINSWESWKLIEYNEKDGNFYLYGKKVKLLHQAGGGNPNTVIKCHLNMFNDKTRAKLQEITGFNE